MESVTLPTIITVPQSQAVADLFSLAEWIVLGALILLLAAAMVVARRPRRPRRPELTARLRAQAEEARR